MAETVIGMADKTLCRRVFRWLREATGSCFFNKAQDIYVKAGLFAEDDQAK